jgi:biopolymer transport protein ExbD
MKRKHEMQKDAEVGFQIAPMIDVVFVIMLFFMVLAGDRQVETLMPMTLPGEESNVDPDAATPMEEQIFVDADGQITHNDAPVNQAELKNDFSLLAKQAEAEGGGTKPTPIVVTIGADPETPWEKVTNVLDAMTSAKIANVTFSVGEE